MSSTEVVPVDRSSSGGSRKLKDRLFIAAYATICAVAMVGWLIALGWLAAQFAVWLLF